MGCVQGKPERRRHGLERKASFAVVPNNSDPSPTDDLCRHFDEDFMRSYQTDCKDDKDLQDFDSQLWRGAEEVIRSIGLHRFEQWLKYLIDSDEMIQRVILSFKKQILGEKDEQARMVMKANEKFLDQILIKEYYNNSLQTHQLCILELQRFIDSAREIHACILDVVREKKVSNKLTKFEKNYHDCAEEVVAKVKSLREQHVRLLKKLKGLKKVDKKLELTGALKKVVNVVYIGMLSGLFICTIMAAAMAAPPVASALTSHLFIAEVVAGGAVVYNFSPVLKDGRHWLLTLIQGHESTLEAHKRAMKLMKARTGDAIKQLDDIMCHVNKVIAKGNDPVLSNISSENDEGTVEVESDHEVIAKEKLAAFSREIEELDERRKECLQVIEKGRKQVYGEYDELKNNTVWSR